MGIKEPECLDAPEKVFIGEEFAEAAKNETQWVDYGPLAINDTTCWLDYGVATELFRIAATATPLYDLEIKGVALLKLEEEPTEDLSVKDRELVEAAAREMVKKLREFNF